MNRLKIIAFTHKNTDLSNIGKLHIEDTQLKERLCFLKENTQLEELMYLSTCNRVEFLISTSQTLNREFLVAFFDAFNPSWSDSDKIWAVDSASVFEGDYALKHLYNVASSIDSLVVGEREIITQVRSAYDICHELQLTGDLIRLVIKHTIETAKEIYTETQIGQKPVSVVSLAYRKLKELDVKLDAKFLIIGAGITNSTMAKYLKKHGFHKITVFNRTFSRAEQLAQEVNGKACLLADLNKHSEGFDVIVTCTAASDFIITREIYVDLIREDKSRKIIIDLAIPNDLDPDLLNSHDIRLISINNLRAVAKENLLDREKELDACDIIIEQNIQTFKQLLKTRKVEIAMSAIPEKIREIRDTAYNSVFAKDIELLDSTSKELLDKVLAYVEKKYISVPMIMAREILIDHTTELRIKN